MGALYSANLHRKMTETKNASRGHLIATTLIGLGLISIGIMFFMLWETSSASPRDFSSIPVEVNFPAPELVLTDLNGVPVSLAEFRGKVVLVNLWATWCPPCREEMPTLQAFHEKYRSRGFVLVAVNQGEKANQIRPFVDDFKLTFPVWLDEKSKASRMFNTMNLPSSYVVDRDGQVRLMWIGGISKKNLERYVPEVIKE
jgi:cytochrome c biogenesis protein CcmG, thiol:disulfide interchange protein DsbE